MFILGIGSTKGSPIPLPEGGYLTDRSGQTVLTALNESMCKQIAQAGNGTYIHVDNTNDAQEKLNNELAKLQRADTQADDGKKVYAGKGTIINNTNTLQIIC